MEIKELIDSAEIRYRKVLEEFFTTVWGETTLYSHDLGHHRRVWQYVKEILLIYSDHEDEPDRIEPEKLLIASYIHDLGMVSEPGFRHGTEGRDLGIRFLKTRNLSTDDFTDVLDAIEYHDDKEYKNSADEQNRILKILSAADDLDAFGYAGIYRYLEIYLARGISLMNVGHEIRKNADARFRNFGNGFRKYDAFYSKHRERYNILDSFMSDYNLQIEGSAPDDYNKDLQHQIVDIISQMVKERINPTGIKVPFNEPGISPGMCDFFNRLYSELNQHQ